jgi:tRNA/tmRNA/rRNA uracil-C5-methylase (TrmA/RlmC/RlmD family)
MLKKVHRIALLRSAPILGAAAAVRTNTSITSINLRSNGARSATFCNASANLKIFRCDQSSHRPNSTEYRSRITVHAQDGVIGFFRRDSHRLIDIERCPISRDEVNRALADLRAQPHVSDGHYTLRASSRPRVFSQTNDAVANALRDLVDNLVAPDQQLLIDAYCGAGFFAKALLDKFERVIGLDWDRFAIEAARQNAAAKESYVAGDVDLAFGRLRSIVSGFRSEKTTLLLDPPAAGLSATMRKAIADLAPSTLIYVSCNPATLARDLKELQGKFTINSVTPLDMFPQTAEIEVAVQLHA